jgi:hypothetical protein
MCFIIHNTAAAREPLRGVELAFGNPGPFLPPERKDHGVWTPTNDYIYGPVNVPPETVWGAQTSYVMISPCGRHPCAEGAWNHCLQRPGFNETDPCPNENGNIPPLGETLRL